MRSRTGRITLALVVGLALVTTGCGDDDESTTTTETLTKEEFITEADAICAEGDAEIETAATEAGLGPDSSKVEVTAFLEETVLPNIRTQLEGIQALGTPEGDSGETEELIAALESALVESEADPAILTSQADPFTEVNQLSGEYGLSDCGGG